MTSILITGANRGLGLNIVKKLLVRNEPPAIIIATCRDPGSAKELQSLAANNPSIHILKLEVTDYDSFGSFAQEVEAIVEDRGLNVLFNNAGINLNRGSFDSTNPQQYIDVYKVNVVAPVFLTKALLPLIERASNKNASKPLGVQRAAIINMSSLLGSCAMNTYGNFCSYRESKAALNIATLSLVSTLKGTGIIAVLLHPGWVKTDMGTEEAPLTPEESVSGIVQVLYKLDESNNGQFLSWEGDIIPW